MFDVPILAVLCCEIIYIVKCDDIAAIPSTCFMVWWTCINHSMRVNYKGGAAAGWWRDSLLISMRGIMFDITNKHPKYQTRNLLKLCRRDALLIFILVSDIKFTDICFAARGSSLLGCTLLMLWCLNTLIPTARCLDIIYFGLIFTFYIARCDGFNLVFFCPLDPVLQHQLNLHPVSVPNKSALLFIPPHKKRKTR